MVGVVQAEACGGESGECFGETAWSWLQSCAAEERAPQSVSKGGWDFLFAGVMIEPSNFHSRRHHHAIACEPARLLLIGLPRSKAGTERSEPESEHPQVGVQGPLLPFAAGGAPCLPLLDVVRQKENHALWWPISFVEAPGQAQGAKPVPCSEHRWP